MIRKGDAAWPKTARAVSKVSILAIIVPIHGGHMLKRMISAAILMLAASASNAAAGIYTDDLSRCLVKSSTPEDKNALMQWIFSNIALNPSLGGLISVTAERRDELAKQSNEIMERLTLSACRAEAITALKNEGARSLAESDQVLGQAAAMGLMNDPKVTSGLVQGAAKFSDRSKWTALFKEAGIDASAASPAAKPAP